jgi:hypothetical protein
MDEFAPETYGQSRSVFIDILSRYLTPQIIAGIHTIYDKTYANCLAINELSKCGSAFQIALSEIPKWNPNTIEVECQRIKTKSQCNFMEDILSCVHILHVKLLTCIRVGNRQKKIDVTCPKLANFIHNVYITVARKMYLNVYLFKKDVTGLELQKNNREIEVIVQECITGVMLDSLPTEMIIRAYLDETVEEEEEISIEPIPPTINADGSFASEKNGVPVATTASAVDDVGAPPMASATVINNMNMEDMVPIEPSVMNMSEEPVVTRLTFNDFDQANDGQTIHAPKSIDRLDTLSTDRYNQRRLESEQEEDSDDPPLNIGENIQLDDIFDLNPQPVVNNTAPALDIIEL